MKTSIERSKGAIQLYTGRLFNPLWPTPDSFTIQDIAQGLVGQHRFSNHTIKDYRVAQHCVIMCQWFRKRGMVREAKWALLHEGSEGLGLGDMPSPIKYLPEMEPYRVLCKNVDFAVFRAFGLLGNPPDAVKELDTRMCAAEAKVVQRPVPEYALEIDTTDIVIKPYKNPNYGKTAFLREFELLFDKKYLTF